MDKWWEQIQLMRRHQRRLMEKASDVIMTRPIPGLDPLSDCAAMLPPINPEDVQ